jgi:membrane protease YdiL (CAAX protease family)
MDTGSLVPDSIGDRQPDGRFWGFWPTVGFGLAFIAVYLFVGTLVGVVFLITILVSQPSLGLTDLTNRLYDYIGLISSISTVLTAIIGVALTVLFIKARRKMSIAEYLGLNKIGWKTVLVLIGVTVILLVVSGLLSYFFKVSDSKFDLQLYQTSIWPPLLWAALVIFAPVSEETLFRGFLFQGFRHSRLGSIGTVILMAIVWSSLHVQYDIYGITSIFILGLVLGIVRLKTNSLWSPLLMHGLWNLVATVQLALVAGGS